MTQRRRKGSERKIALERIDILFRLAEREAVAGNSARADRYASLAAKIGMRYNVRLPREFKRNDREGLARATCMHACQPRALRGGKLERGAAHPERGKKRASAQ